MAYGQEEPRSLERELLTSTIVTHGNILAIEPG
jgi:hypothetical protein